MPVVRIAGRYRSSLWLSPDYKKPSRKVKATSGFVRQLATALWRGGGGLAHPALVVRTYSPTASAHMRTTPTQTPALAMMPQIPGPR
jgi:hypothetical protein